MQPPFQPNVSAQTDVKYFDKEFVDMPVVNSEVLSGFRIDFLQVVTIFAVLGMFSSERAQRMLKISKVADDGSQLVIERDTDATKRAIGRPKTRRYGRERALTNFQNLKNLSILRMVSPIVFQILRDVFSSEGACEKRTD